jgi:hypothetical protein
MCGVWPCLRRLESQELSRLRERERQRERQRQHAQRQRQQQQGGGHITVAAHATAAGGGGVRDDGGGGGAPRVSKCPRTKWSSFTEAAQEQSSSSSSSSSCSSSSAAGGPSAAGGAIALDGCSMVATMSGVEGDAAATLLPWAQAPWCQALAHAKAPSVWGGSPNSPPPSTPSAAGEGGGSGGGCAPDRPAAPPWPLRCSIAEVLQRARRGNVGGCHVSDLCVLVASVQQPPSLGPDAASAGDLLVSHSCACIGSPCLRHCVHGASIGGGGGGGSSRRRRRRRQPACVRRVADPRRPDGQHARDGAPPAAVHRPRGSLSARHSPAPSRRLAPTAGAGACGASSR